MPRYYFDVDDGERAVPDDSGLDCADRERVRYEAIRALPDIARDVLPDGDHRELTVRVRDEAGRVVFVASLRLDAAWIDEDQQTAPTRDGTLSSL